MIILPGFCIGVTPHESYSNPDSTFRKLQIVG